MLSTYIFNIEELTVWQNFFVKLLTDSEKKQLGNIKNNARAVNYTAGHALIKLLLLKKYHFPASFLADFNFATGRWGKPYCQVNNTEFWQFNISHSANLLAIAIATVPVGIDIEEYSYAAGDLAPLLQHFHTREKAQLSTLPYSERQQLIINLWCAKEALTKACGTGLLTPLNSFTLDITALQCRRPQQVVINKQNFLLLANDTTSYAMSIAVGTETDIKRELKFMSSADTGQLMDDFSALF